MRVNAKGDAPQREHTQAQRTSQGGKTENPQKEKQEKTNAKRNFFHAEVLLDLAKDHSSTDHSDTHVDQQGTVHSGEVRDHGDDPKASPENLSHMHCKGKEKENQFLAVFKGLVPIRHSTSYA